MEAPPTKNTIMDLLVCPTCSVSLMRTEGQFRCTSCGAAYPIIGGMPNFVAPLSFKEEVKHTQTSFDLQWEMSVKRGEYNHFDPTFREKLVPLLLDDVMLEPEFFSGRHVLDAGCGVGRWVYALDQLGATVTAFDYNDRAARITHDYFRDKPNIATLQADVFHLPFPPKTFDFILSWGVLHHTRDTKEAFDGLVPLLKDGGTLFVMLYERFNAFKLSITELVRKVTLGMERERLYRVSIGLARFGQYRPIRYALKPFIDIGESAEGIYDSFAKSLNHHHTAAEVFGWFREHGFSNITINGSRQYGNPLFRWLQGTWGGTLRMRGDKVTRTGSDETLKVVTGGAKHHV